MIVAVVGGVMPSSSDTVRNSSTVSAMCDKREFIIGLSSETYVALNESEIMSAIDASKRKEGIIVKIAKEEVHLPASRNL